MEKRKYPIRINKYLADQKHSTRRGADELISKGIVFINDRQAKLGEMVNEGDRVEVRYRGGEKKKLVYLAYNKPVGIVTHSAGAGQKEISDKIPMKGTFPIGRLDKESSGLMILTNDGRITDRLLNPEFEHEKEYLVTTKEKLRTSFKTKMEAGVRIDHEKTKRCKVDILGEKKFKVTLTEGKKHQIRRMCVALFQEVDTLERIRIMNIKLGNLQPNAFRNIEDKELETFLASLNLA